MLTDSEMDSGLIQDEEMLEAIDSLLMKLVEFDKTQREREHSLVTLHVSSIPSSLNSLMSSPPSIQIDKE